MECLRTRQEVLDAEPSERLAVLRCEDPRCENCTRFWVFQTDYGHYDVMVDFWERNSVECLCASVEITTVADFLAGKTGDVEHFSSPLWDGELDEESGREDGEETDND